jgi:hypothetical protein
MRYTLCGIIETESWYIGLVATLMSIYSCTSDFNFTRRRYKILLPISKMADPLSIAASLLSVILTVIQTIKSLYDTVQQFMDCNKSLRRLQDELEELTNILFALIEVTHAETLMLALLQAPIHRYSQICSEFKQLIRAFSEKLKTDFRDWAKMEFMRGDINEFIHTIAAYKSTLSVRLGTITMLAIISHLYWSLLTSTRQAYLKSLPSSSSRA